MEPSPRRSDPTDGRRPARPSPPARRTPWPWAVVSALLLLPAALTSQAPASAGDSSGPPPACAPGAVLPLPPRCLLVELPELRVEARRPARRGKLRGFDRRRRLHPSGRFIGRAEIERRDPHRLSDLLHGVPGLRLGRPAAGVGERHAVSGRAGRHPGREPCRVAFFVDGVRLPPSSGFSVDELSPADVAGIEIYRGTSEAPARFRRRGDRCGVIVVWTRDPGATAPTP